MCDVSQWCTWDRRELIVREQLIVHEWSYRFSIHFGVYSIHSLLAALGLRVTWPPCSLCRSAMGLGAIGQPWFLSLLREPWNKAICALVSHVHVCTSRPTIVTWNRTVLWQCIYFQFQVHIYMLVITTTL